MTRRKLLGIAIPALGSPVHVTIPPPAEMLALVVGKKDSVIWRVYKDGGSLAEAVDRIPMDRWHFKRYHRLSLTPSEEEEVLGTLLDDYAGKLRGFMTGVDRRVPLRILHGGAWMAASEKRLSREVVRA